MLVDIIFVVSPLYWSNHSLVNFEYFHIFTGVGVLNNLLYAVGGHDGPLVRKSVEVFDPLASTWKQVADMNMCRRNAGIPNNYFKILVILFGVNGMFLDFCCFHDVAE